MIRVIIRWNRELSTDLAYTEENQRKPQLEDLLIKIVLPVIAWSGVPYLQMKLVGGWDYAFPIGSVFL